MSGTQDVVPPILRKVLARVVEAGIPKEFYLAGGTGLALLLNHRRSVDLDFFSRTDRLGFTERRALLAQLRQLPRWTLLEAKDGTLLGRVGRVRVSFFYYPEPLVRPVVRQGPVRIASIEDIGLMKLGAVVGRGSRKDFVDLYAICRHRPLADLLALAPKKFKDAGDFTLQALKALSYFEDAERDPPVVTPVPVAWEPVKAYFTREVRLLARRYVRGAPT